MRHFIIILLCSFRVQDAQNLLFLSFHCFLFCLRVVVANVNASARLIDKWSECFFFFVIVCMMLIINYNNCCRYTQFSFEFTDVFFVLFLLKIYLFVANEIRNAILFSAAPVPRLQISTDQSTRLKVSWVICWLAGLFSPIDLHSLLLLA